MARGRMISKSLSTSEKFAALTTTAGTLAEFCQALYPLIVTHTDDFGRLQGDPFTVKMMCFPASPRPCLEFTAALQHLHTVGLIVWYSVENKQYLQVVQFEPHQQGLHKRTASKFPDLPGSSEKFTVARARGTELKGRELKGRELKIPVTNNKLVRKTEAVTTSAPPLHANGHALGEARSKRPIFSGQRLTVFEWMFDDCCKTLGPLLDQFDIHEWFFSLDTMAATAHMVIPKRDNGVWLQSQLVAEAKRRGLPIAVADDSPTRPGRVAVIAAAVATIRREEAQ